MRPARYPLWLWIAGCVTVLMGAVAGGALYHTAIAVTSALQTKTIVMGWSVIAILAVVAVVWVAAVVIIARMLEGRARWAFLIVAIVVGGVSFVSDMVPAAVDDTVEIELVLPPSS